MKKLFIKLGVLAIFITIIFSASSALAGTTGEVQDSKIIPQCLLANDIKVMHSMGCDNVNIFIWLAINVGTYIFTFIGALALLFFVYGGFMLIMSQGKADKIKQGTGAMTAAVIGLIIAFSAYALINFLGTTIGLKADKSLNFVDTVYAQTDIAAVVQK
jgi:Type IV secretion system pilin